MVLDSKRVVNHIFGIPIKHLRDKGPRAPGHKKS